MEIIFFVVIPIMFNLLTIGIGLFAGLAALVAGLAYLAGISYVIYRLVQWFA